MTTLNSSLVLEPEERVALALLVGAATSQIMLLRGDRDPATRVSLRAYLAEAIARPEACLRAVDKVLEDARELVMESVARGRSEPLAGRNVLNGEKLQPPEPK